VLRVSRIGIGRLLTRQMHSNLVCQRVIFRICVQQRLYRAAQSTANGALRTTHFTFQCSTKFSTIQEQEHLSLCGKGCGMDIAPAEGAAPHTVRTAVLELIMLVDA
jgi:hypothetical protein